MIHQQLNLSPFSPQDLSLNCQIKADLLLDQKDLSIDFQVFGDVADIEIPSSTNTPQRQDDLWENTCFEFFLGVSGSTAYWEFNLSPSGDWNVYSFTDYRVGMKLEEAFTDLPFQFTQESDRLSLKVRISLDQIKINSQRLELAITTVIKDHNGKISYWALEHTGKQADFHRRDSFVCP